MIRYDGSLETDYVVKGVYFLLNQPKRGRFGRRKVIDETDISVSDEKRSQVFRKMDGRSLYVCTTKKESLTWLNLELEKKTVANCDLSNTVVFVTDYFKDSAIHKNYIIAAILRGLSIDKKPQFVFKEFREEDRINMIEDDYNKAYSFRHLTRHYKRQLEKTISKIVDDSQVQKEDGYASNSVVE